MKLKTGQIVFTAGIEQHISNPNFKRFIDWNLSRHRAADWGDCCPEDIQRNNRALETGGRIISEFLFTPDLATIHPDAKIWIITEASRLTTTVLFPSEY